MRIKTVGVVGLGLMGSSIVACVVRHGFTVIGHDLNPAAVRRSSSQVRAALCDLARHDASGRDATLRLKRYRVTPSIADLASCDLVVEAIVENKQAKLRVIAELEKVLPPGAVIASNTSSIPISILQSNSRRPERIIGMHWAEPAHITRFMEIVCGAKTSRAARKMAVEFAERCGKEPSVLKKDIRGFITNRCFYALLREAFHLVESGVCTVADVDRSLRNDLGWWITLAGPFRFMDLTGIPAYKTVMEGLNEELCNSKKVPRLMQQVVASGARGVSNAKGFYRYTPREAREWEKKFIRFSHDIRTLALKYPEV